MFTNIKAFFKSNACEDLFFAGNILYLTATIIVFCFAIVPSMAMQAGTIAYIMFLIQAGGWCLGIIAVIVVMVIQSISSSIQKICSHLRHMAASRERHPVDVSMIMEPMYYGMQQVQQYNDEPSALYPQYPY